VAHLWNPIDELVVLECCFPQSVSNIITSQRIRWKGPKAVYLKSWKTNLPIDNLNVCLISKGEDNLRLSWDFIRFEGFVIPHHTSPLGALYQSRRYYLINYIVIKRC